MRILFPLVLLVLATGTGRAQGDEAVPTLRISTRIVSVATLVRDRDGRPVGGLTRENFEVRQDGKPQPVTYFSQGADLPLNLQLMIDTSGSQRRFIPDETEAGMIFFRAMLSRPEDRAGLVQFDSNVLELSPMTASVENLQRSLGYLSYPHKSLLPQPGTLLYDAICTAAGHFTGSGRRAMVLLTDGGDNGSRNTLEAAIAAAQRADIVVDSVFYSEASVVIGSYTPAPTADQMLGREALEKLSAATGGRVYDVNRGQSLREIFKELGDDLRLEYLLGYRAPVLATPDAPGTYHKLEVRLLHPEGPDRKLKVQARRGFYTPGEESAKSPGASNR